MWILLFFDLPMRTTSNRQAYRSFKRELKKMGFHRLQYSVYARIAAHRETICHILSEVLSVAPQCGNIKMIPIANLSYQRMIHLEDGQLITCDYIAPLSFW